MCEAGHAPGLAEAPVVVGAAPVLEQQRADALARRPPAASCLLADGDDGADGLVEGGQREGRRVDPFVDLVVGVARNRRRRF